MRALLRYIPVGGFLGLTIASAFYAGLFFYEGDLFRGAGALMLSFGMLNFAGISYAGSSEP